MPVIVEDGSIVANANSYKSESDLVTYATERGYSEVAALSTNELTALLLSAMDYIESKKYKGDIVDATQALCFPRSGIVTRDRGELPSDSIPNQLGEAQLVLSVKAHTQPLFFDETQAQKQSFKVDAIETKFFKSPTQQPKFPLVDRLLSTLVISRSMRVSRV